MEKARRVGITGHSINVTETAKEDPSLCPDLLSNQLTTVMQL